MEKTFKLGQAVLRGDGSLWFVSQEDPVFHRLFVTNGARTDWASTDTENIRPALVVAVADTPLNRSELLKRERRLNDLVSPTEATEQLAAAIHAALRTE